MLGEKKKVYKVLIKNIKASLLWLPIFDAFKFIFYNLFKNNKPIKTRFCGIELFLRPFTTDIIVAEQILKFKEFNGIDLNKCKIIIDAGAYIGISSIYFALKYPEAKVYAIEMENNNFQMLLLNTKNYKNIICMRNALASEITTKEIYNRFTGEWGYTIAETNNKKESIYQKVETITIDKIMEKYNIDYIDILKLDVEGAEKEIFENSKNWIDKTSLIIVELHDRIIPGCERAFFSAAKDYKVLKNNAKKVIVYRNNTNDE